MNRQRAGRPLHTYSIVAVDRRSGEIGVAVQSHWFSVGSVVPWAEAGVGAVVTQSFVNPAYGPEGLALLKAGRSPAEVVSELTAADEGRELRQLAVIDRQGNAAAFTGSRCVPAAGHLVGDGYSVLANMMAAEEVWPAMARAFEEKDLAPTGSGTDESADTGPGGGLGRDHRNGSHLGGSHLAEGLLAALQAAQGAGGDLRGQQSAALLVVAVQASGKIWEDRRIDLRVEDHPRPLDELARLLKVFRAYEHMNRGDLAVENQDTELALREYAAAERLCPDNLEMRFWHAVSLAGVGRAQESLPLFQEVFAADPAWRVMARRIAALGLLALTDPALRALVTGRNRP